MFKAGGKKLISEYHSLNKAIHLVSMLFVSSKKISKNYAIDALVMQ